MDFRVIWSSLAKTTLGLGFILMGFSAQAGGLSDPDNNDGLIEVEYPVEALLPYRERRPSNQFTFHVQYENYQPTGYVSPTFGSSYNETYQNEATPLISGALGWKHNLSFLGLEVAAFYGNGGLIDTQNGETVTLDLSKYGLKFAAYADTLFKEPYIVPYAAVQALVWDVSEKTDTDNFSRTTGYATGLQVGLLLQLNWIEPISSLGALNESGLTNTYLDIFAQQYGDTSDSSDPKMSSEFNWGAGFRMEY